MLDIILRFDLSAPQKLKKLYPEVAPVAATPANSGINRNEK
jgi:hypothetical protein